MAILSKKDFIDSGIFTDVQKEIDTTKAKLIELTNAARNLSTEQSGAGAKAMIDNAKALTAETDKLIKAEKLQQEELKKLALIEKNRTQEQLNEIKLSKAQETASKQKIAQLEKEKSAYYKLSQEYAKAAKEAKDLAAQYGINSKEATKAAEAANKLGNQLKQIDAKVGQHTRNVGNYTSAWGKFGANLKDLFLAGGIVGLVTLAFQKITGFFKSSTEEAESAAKSFAKVEQAIKSTGGAAGFTTSQLKKYDDQLERLTNIDADQIMEDVTGNLLTFTKVIGEQFPRAQKAILDVSVGLKQDLKSSTIQVGKALNDPIKGIGALSRVGVTFSATQKEMIKNFVKTGEVAKAQNIILKELETEFGGQAEAAAKAGLGTWQKLGIVWNNIKENVGNFLIPIINDFADGLIKVFDWIGKIYNQSMAFVVDFVNGWIDLYNESRAFRTIVESISTVITSLWDTFKLFFGLAGNGLSFFGKQIAYVFNPKNWGAGFSEGLAKIVTENLKESAKEVHEFGKKIGNNVINGFEASIKGNKKKLSLGDVAINGIGDVLPKKQPKEPMDPDALKKIIEEEEKFLKLLDEQIEKEEKIQKEFDAKKAENKIPPIAEAITIEEEMHRNKYNELLDMDKQFRDQLDAQAKQSAENQKLIEEEKAEIINQLYSSSQEIATNLTDALVDDRLQKIQTAAQAEKDILKDKLDKGLISEQDYNAKLLEIDRKTKTEEAKAERKKALYTIAIETAVAIAKAWGNPIKIAAAAIIGALQTATVLAKPLPKFAKGEINIKGKSHAEGGIIAEIEDGESVISRLGTHAAPMTLDLINRGMLKDKDTLGGVKPDMNLYILSELQKSNKTNKQMLTAISNMVSQYKINGITYTIFANGKVNKEY